MSEQMTKLLLSILFLLLALTDGFSQSQRSDTLFARGVELYQQGRYQEAIPVFVLCDSLDKAELDSTSGRRGYAELWMASAYHRLGDDATAKSISPRYLAQPVDRRLTVSSDSVSELMNKAIERKDYERAIGLCREMMDLELPVVGENHYFIANDYAALAYLYSEQGDMDRWREYETRSGDISRLNFGDVPMGYGEAQMQLLIVELHDKCYDKALEHARNLRPIFAQHDEWAKENGLYLFVFCDDMLDDYPLTAALADELVDMARPLCDIPDSAHGSWWYGRVVTHCANVLEEKQEYGQAVGICRKAFDVYKANGVRNRSRRVICDRLYNLYHDFYEAIPADQPDYIRAGAEQAMLQVADDMMTTLQLTVGRNHDWADMCINKAIVLTQSQQIADYDLSMQLLDSAFHVLTADTLLTDSAAVGKSLLLLSRSYSTFCDLNMQEQFVEYAEKLTNHPLADFEKYNLAWYFLASTYSSVKIKRPADALSIYRRMASQAQSLQDDEMYADMLERIVDEEYYSHHYEQAMEALQTLNALITTHHDLGHHSRAHFRANRVFRMAECAFNMNDTASTRRYQAQAMQLLRHCVDTNSDGDSTYTWRQKVDDLRLLADLACNNFNGTWLNESNDSNAVPYLEEALAIAQKEGATLETFNLHKSLALRHMGYKVNHPRQAREHIEKAWALCADDTLGYMYSRVLWLMGNYYDEMSVEPELALAYYLKSIEITGEVYSDATPSEKLSMDNTSPWWSCAELCFYLGNDEDGLRYQKRYIDAERATRGNRKEATYYEEEAIRKDIEVHSPAMVRDWRHWVYEENVHVDLDRCRLLADSLERLLMRDTLFDAHDNYFRMRDICKAFDAKLAEDYERKAVKAIEKLPVEQRYANAYYFRFLLDGAERRGPKDVIKTGQQLVDVYRGDSLNPQLITTLFSMARAYTQMNKGQQALSYYQDALSRAHKSIPNGYDNPRLPLAFALAADSCRDYRLIKPYYAYICQTLQKELMNRFENAREDEREDDWRKYEQVFCMGEKMLDGESSEQLLTCTYNNLLFRKGILLNSSISAMNLIMASGDSLLMAKYDKKEWLKKQLQDNHEGDIINKDGRKLSREVACKLVKRFENEIMLQASKLGNYTSALVTTSDDVRQAMQQGETAIEFTCYRRGDNDAYAALVMRSDGTLSFVPLFTQQQLDDAYKNDGKGTATLYDIVWKPLLPYISNGQRVYFSPDGQLHNLPLESALTPSGKYASEQFSLYRVSSTRELVKARANQQVQSAVLYGGIKYKLEQQERIHAEQVPSFVFRDVPNIQQLRGAVRGIPYLPGSKKEVDTIQAVLQNEKIAVLLNDGPKASEESFKALSGKRIPLVHISTHGFYEHQDSADSLFNDHEYTALMRTGLLLAGASDYLYGGETATDSEDGILTAHEISKLNLRGLSTVVLSACETALGDITGDGVFGLQRGFKKAGAQSILMTLWKVDDEATCLMMTEFYNNWLVDKKTMREALEAAKQTVRQHKEKGWDDPKYWAAFVLLDALD